MASFDTGSSGTRNPNFELNLVPFIDLMSVLITFLLITAVWTQVSMIQIGSSLYGKQTSEEPVELPPLADLPFRLDVKNAGYRVIIGKETIEVPKQAGQFDDETLLARLQQIKEKYPEKLDAVITMEDDIFYEKLINGMDMLIQAGFPSISVATGGAQ